MNAADDFSDGDRAEPGPLLAHSSSPTRSGRSDPLLLDEDRLDDLFGQGLCRERLPECPAAVVCVMSDEIAALGDRAWIGKPRT